ncbi:MAG: hypothetical protein LBR19_09965 [Bifidobacteriaceae bacterium]|nr:hypothetical protein [Bifidobacteriaceae bacterium]
MDQERKLTILTDQFQSSAGELVPGLTVILDGQMRQIFDVFMAKRGAEDYAEVLYQVLVAGVNQIMAEIRPQRGQ